MNRSRWLVLLGALLVQPCLGALYAWGVFVTPLQATRAELTVTLSAKVLQVDPTAHAELVAEYRRLKGQVSQAHGTARDAAKGRGDPIPGRRSRAAASFRRGLGQAVLWLQRHAGPVDFSTGILVFSLMMIVAGRWQDRVWSTPGGPDRRIGAGRRLRPGGAGGAQLSGRLAGDRRDRRSRHRPGLCLSGGGLREVVSRHARD